jgi:hypothetical protein
MRKLNKDEAEAEKIRLAGEIRSQYSTLVPVPNHFIDVTVTREFRHGSTHIVYVARVEATGWVANTAPGDTELKALRALYEMLMGRY